MAWVFHFKMEFIFKRSIKIRVVQCVSLTVRLHVHSEQQVVSDLGAVHFSPVGVRDGHDASRGRPGIGDGARRRDHAGRGEKAHSDTGFVGCLYHATTFHKEYWKVEGEYCIC